MDDFKTRANELLDQLRAAIDEEQLNEAQQHAQDLQTLITDWHQMTVVDAAKTWLDAALQADLLAFNTDTANQYIKQWQNSQPDDETLDDYKEKVQERTTQKIKSLQVRGVIAYCDEQLTRADSLERGETPPEPDFMMRNYYDKVKAILSAALAEHKVNDELDMLSQRIERIYSNKALANRIYTTAIKDHRYTNAVNDLDKLPNNSLIPRFIASDEGQTLFFHSMVSITEARTEINNQATKWAQKQAATCLQTTQEKLSIHHPQEALDALTAKNTFIEFLDEVTRQKFATLQQQAEADLANKQLAESSIQQALEMVEENPLGAWDLYAKAHQTYQWVLGLAAARETITQALTTRLEHEITSAEAAFNNRDMTLVREISKKAQTLYSGKTPALDEMLGRLTEVNELTHQFDEYVKNASTTITEVKKLLWEDAAGANELMSQLESYPDIVLEEFAELHDLRMRVNERLNADSTYSTIFSHMYDGDRDAVRTAIKAAEEAIETYPDDNRFTTLRHGLRVHMMFIDAQAQQEAGNTDKAKELLQAIIAVNDHPDHEPALSLMQHIDNS